MHPVGIVMRPARADEGELFFEIRRDGLRAYAERAFGPWDDAFHRTAAAADFAALPIEIVERDGTAIGYQIVERKADHWWLDEIVVIAAERGRGLGTQLITSIMHAARAACMSVRLSVLEVNPAQGLYARLGFRVTRIERPRVTMEWP
jgi:ribosomal protein S18 acetylase RimI-like enzyme